MWYVKKNKQTLLHVRNLFVLVDHCKKSHGAYWHHGESCSPQRVNQFGRIHSLPELEAEALPGNKSSEVKLIAYSYTQHAWLSNQKLLTYTLFAFEME